MSRGVGVKGAVLVSLVLCVLAVAATSGAAVKPQTISLLEVEGSFVGTGGLDENFDKPPTAGQGFVLESDFYKWNGTKRGKHAGTLEVVCTFTKINVEQFAASLICTGAALLPGGQITIAGRIKEANLFDIPIVGGTGIYAGARGYVRVKNIGGENSNNSADTIVITG